MLAKLLNKVKLSPKEEGCKWCALRCALRGGNWNNGVKSGVSALNLNNSPTNINVNNIGFRCDSAENEITISLRRYSQCTALRT